MLITLCLAALLVVGTSLCHYEALTQLSQNLGACKRARLSILVLILILPLIHLIEISFYASAYYIMRNRFHLGTLAGESTNTFLTYLYFSIETFTTLGLGDVIPKGTVRFLAGVEALNGSILIGWSGSFIFITMQRFWGLGLLNNK